MIISIKYFFSGAHAIGNSHCFSFDNRLHKYNAVSDIDPSFDPAYAIILRNKCKPGNNTVVEMVPGSSISFDTNYYKLVAKRQGLFHSDESLLDDTETRNYVYSRLDAPESSFFYDFGVSMINMGSVGVLTGNAGEIRKNCALVNY
ncbi:peroxidase 27-like [Canna indica]|uniref:Peroxidase 27-like n=1 Tax=Canna indica TaxID=4628 RepID=A0AAQ3QMN4_9LILI|nr:peroxidase 27-like [Canna indica]